jgi:two-component system, OmpR family, response regulator RegX3
MVIEDDRDAGLEELRSESSSAPSFTLVGSAEGPSVGAAAIPDDGLPAEQASAAQQLRALIDRLSSLVRQAARGAARPEPTAETLQCGDVSVNLLSRSVRCAGQVLNLTQREFDLLCALLRRRGAIATRHELLRDVWGPDVAVGRRVIDVHVARLRRKLEDDPARPRRIVTVLAVGYRFVPQGEAAESGSGGRPDAP